MKSKFILLIAFCSLLSCQTSKPSKKIKIVSEVPANFEMYKTSEMAALMRKMLEKNKVLRQQIIAGEEIGDFNEAYLEVHTAKLTDDGHRDETYPTFANHFVKMQQEVFEVAKSDRKKQFNEAINACVACHQDRCTGPIPRIKKLLIN